MSFLGTMYSMLVSWLLGEVMELWKDGTLRDLAKEAVEYAEGAFEGNEEKRDAAIDKLMEDASSKGKEIAKEGALMLVEKAVQRYLK